MFTELIAPIYVQWETTPWCNHSCVHCYNHWRSDGNQEPYPEGTNQLHWQVAREMVSSHVMHVTVTGGEPLGVIRQVAPIIQYLTESGIKVGLNSNLTLLDSDMIQLLKSIDINSVLTSLPSGNETTADRITQVEGSWGRTVRGIRLAQEAGMTITVNMVVSKINVTEVFSTGEFVAGLGIKSFSATKAATPGNCPDFSDYRLSISEFRQALFDLSRVHTELGLNVDSLEFYPFCGFDDAVVRKMFGSTRSCSAARTTCTIGFNGQVRPCSHATDEYGHISDGLQAAWLAMHDWRTDKWIPEECQECSDKKRCAGGCKVEALIHGGSYAKPDPYCDFSQLPLDKLPPSRPPQVVLDEERPFRFNPEISARQESFGGLLYISTNNWAPINHQLYQLALSSLEKGGDVTIQKLAETLEVSVSDAMETARFLASRKLFIQEV